MPIASIQAGMTNKTGAHTLCQPIPYNVLQYHAILFVMTNKTLTTVNLVGSEVEYTLDNSKYKMRPEHQKAIPTLHCEDLRMMCA